MPKGKPAPSEDLVPVTAAEVDVNTFLEELGPPETVVEIFRLRDDGRRPQCGTVTMDLFRENPYHYLRQTYGPGRYHLRFKDQNRKYLAGSIYLEVEAMMNPNVNAPAAPVQPQNSVSDMMLQMMQSQNQFMQTLLMGMMQSFKAPDLTPLIALMKPPDLITTISAIQSLNKPEEKSSVKETLEVLEAARGFIGDGSNGNGAEKGDMISLATTLGGKVLDVISNAQQNNRAAQPQRAIAPGAELAPVELEQPALQLPLPPPKVNEEEMLKKWLLAQLALLKQKARAGKPVDFWIDYIINNEEEPGCAAILQAIDRGATLEHLLEFDPEIAADPLLKLWFQNLYEGLQPESESVSQSNDESGNPPELAPAGESRNGGNHAANGDLGSEGKPNRQSSGAVPKKSKKR